MKNAEGLAALLSEKSGVFLQQLGLGDHKAQFCVYLANSPPMPEYQQLDSVVPLAPGDIDRIYRNCGNGWRKIFNVYAKLLFTLDKELFPYAQQASSWQAFRDNILLQQGSNTALLFSPPQLALSLAGVAGQPQHHMHLIAGRTHAKQLLAEGLQAELHWLNEEFAIDTNRNLLVTPFFDYRQLNNEKIGYTATLLAALLRQQAGVLPG